MEKRSISGSGRLESDNSEGSDSEWGGSSSEGSDSDHKVPALGDSSYYEG